VPQEAASGGPFDVGGTDVTDFPQGPIFTANAILVGWNNTASGGGILGRAAPGGIGVFGTSSFAETTPVPGDFGVMGTAISTGVFGSATATEGGTGVAGMGKVGVFGHALDFGSANDFGVVGESAAGTGVAGSSTSGTGATGSSNSGPGVAGFSAAGNGVAGFSATGNGVFGETQGDGAGVMGQSVAGPGVYGLSDDWHGVIGFSTSRGGVLGVTDTQTPGVDAGVAGVATAAGTGVLGQSKNGPGVYATSDENVAVHGYAPKKYAIYAEGGQAAFYGTSQQGFGVIARSESGVGVSTGSNTSIGLFAGTRTGPAAAFFEGNVFIAGNLTVTGTKHAAVPRAGGAHTLLYCLECPESWLEDFGEARLVNGRAKIPIDRGFAQTIDARSYHVFISAYGAEHVFVSKRSRNGFEIRAVPREGSEMPKSLRCSYRIVARRRAVKASRLKRIQLPSIPELLPKAEAKRSRISPADLNRTLNRSRAARKRRRGAKAARRQTLTKPPRFPRLPKIVARAKLRGRRKNAR
jgi:hypothetical protein